MAIDGAKIVKQYETLKSARSQRDTVIAVMAPYTDPSRGSTQDTTPVEGQPWMSQVYDSGAIFAHDISARYIQGQSDNPGEKWFNLRDANPAVNEEDKAKEWLEESRDRMLTVIDQSNFYGSDYQIKKDWWGFGCGSGLVEEKQLLPYRPSRGYRGLNLNFDMLGRFVAGWDSWGKVNMHGVERMWTVAAAVERFGLDKCGEKIKACYQNGKMDEQFKFIHFISPRGSGEYGEQKKQKLAFKSCWVEYDSKNVCEESGYDQMPALVPRQNGLFGEQYGRGRADIALNDTLTLSTGKRLSFEDWALKIRPITMVRSQVLFGQQNLVPGSFIQANWNLGRPLSDAFFEYNGGGKPEVSEFNVENLRAAIDNAYLIKQLQQVLAIQGSHQQTAYERAQLERHVLRLIASIHTEYENQFLQPFIDLLFDQMYAAGEFSPPPDVMIEQGGKLMVVFDSPLTRVRSSDEVQQMEEAELRMLGHAKEYFAATGKPSPILDLIDFDAWYRAMFSKMKVPAGPVRSGREVAMIRESRAEEERNQMVNQELAGGAEALGKVAPFMKVMQGGKQAA